MLVATLDASAMAGVRLAMSPALEALSWLRITAGGARHPVFGDPGPAARFALRDRDVALVARSMPPIGRGGYSPDLLTPRPPAVRTDLIMAAQLAESAETAADVAAAQVARTDRPVHRDLRAAVDAGTYARRAARGLAVFWQAAIGDGWGDLRARFDADLAVRATTMATEGVGGLFGSLHPNLEWTGSALWIRWPGHRTVQCRGGLVLSPSLLETDRCLQLQLSDTDTSVISYPAGAGPRPAGVSRLVGASRATLLNDLNVARTTSDLSSRHGLARATVSYHLSVLLESGLVSKVRDGKAVLYRRTALGDTLR
ncbi:helix-turn-helix domain-containing protein [Actinokineospora sp. HUAS TT18]|uniref:helix-turn-helix domain-containing protein n=1 Tax=Actinokineospora sp. HUAS TT18 TaxID=3447451 RepID=UPI003F51F133